MVKVYPFIPLWKEKTHNKNDVTNAAIVSVRLVHDYSPKLPSRVDTSEYSMKWKK